MKGKRSPKSLCSSSFRLRRSSFCFGTRSSPTAGCSTLLGRFWSFNRRFLWRIRFGSHDFLQDYIVVGIFRGIDGNRLRLGGALPLLVLCLLFRLLGSFLDPYLTEFKDPPSEVFSGSADLFLLPVNISVCLRGFPLCLRAGDQLLHKGMMLRQWAYEDCME